MSNQDLDIIEQQQQQLQISPERPLHRRSFPICPKCNQNCSSKDEGEFVRAFNQVYHYKCFICEDCLQPVADKYYLIVEKNNTRRTRRRKQVLCEYHHMKRLGLICPKCNQPITTPEQKFHPQCIQCPSCVTPTISQYEHKGISYCRIHYSLIQETHCAGCNQAILKQFVEHVDLPNKIWHPECYMIYKFWTVKLAPNPTVVNDESKIIDIQIQVEQKVTRVWTDLSSFEESSANCISDMLLNVAAGAYVEGIRMANQFIMHLQVLFSALDIIHHHLVLYKQELNCNKEADLVCKQMIRFFELLTVPSKTDMSITQELLSLVTGLAQNLKSLIRIGLSAALHLEREIGIENAIPEFFLNQLLELEKKRVWIAGRYWFKDPPPSTIDTTNLTTTAVETCNVCHLVIQDTNCFQNQDQHLKWHPTCFSCATCSTRLNEKTALLLLNSATLYCQSCCNDCTTMTTTTCTHVTLLQQYLYNLKLYLAKLSSVSSSSSSSSTFIAAANNKSLSNNNEIIIPAETKRQRSILRMLGNRSQTTTSAAAKPNRLDSVHLGQIQCTSLEEETSFYSKKKKANNNLMISTTTTTDSQQQQQSSPTSPVVMVIPKTTNRITSSIRRTFSTNSHSSSTTTTTKQRISLYSVFDRKREARKASILTLDDTGHTTNKTIYLSTLTPMQDFIVRHVALITIQPLTQFSLDELIDLIEIKKKQKKRNTTLPPTEQHYNNPASALWGKLITHMKASSTVNNNNNNNNNKTFGVPLSTLVAREQEEINNKRQQKKGSGGVTLCDFTPALAASFSDNAFIPIFVKSCIMAILQSDMSIKGVFRKNGNIRQLKIISESIDQSSPTDIMDLSSENSIQLAALLKRYLRELPEPLMTFSLYKVFVQCGKINGQEEEEEERKRILHLACCLLPKANRDTMLLIFCCLKWVATFSDTNKMDIPNLARVIAPNVLYSLDATNADLRQGAQEEINVIETLIREADQISIIPSELILLALQENINQDISDLNSRYFIKHYIQLLTDLRNQKSKSENNSPVSTTTTNKKLTRSTLLSKYQIGLPKPLNITTTTNSPSSVSSSPISTPITPSKQRRMSWIPTGLLVKK